jgi:RNA-directed DNA polymerase
LHRWATEDAGRRFDDLFNLVYDPAFLRHAWERVSSNAGSKTPGIDKATVVKIETWIGVETFLGQIRESLKSVHRGDRPDAEQLLQSLDALVTTLEHRR